MCDQAIDKPPASEEVSFFDTLIDGLKTSAKDVAGVFVESEQDHDEHAGLNHHDEQKKQEDAESFSSLLERIFFPCGEAPERATDPVKDANKFANFAGLTFGADMSAGVVKTDKHANGDTVQTRMTINADLTYREQAQTRNQANQLVGDSDASKSVDGTAWSKSTKYDALTGKVAERVDQFEEDDGTGFATTVQYDAAGNVRIQRDSYSYAFGEVGECIEFSAAQIKEARELLGKGKDGHDLLTKLGGGDAAIGLLVLQDLGDGDIEKGAAVLSRFGKTGEDGIGRLTVFGSGSAQQGVMRLYRISQNNIDTALGLLQTFGEGNLEKGLWRLEQLGGIKGNAGKGIETIEYLSKNYDFATAIKNLVKLAREHGKGESVDEGIKIMQSLGRGNSLEGARTCRLLGDGDAGLCGANSRILGGKDSMAGLQFLIHGLSDRYSVRQHLETIRRLHLNNTVAGGLENVREHGGGNCQDGLCSIEQLGEDRQGNRDLNVGVDTVFQLFPSRPDQVVDPQQALTYVRQQYGTYIGPGGEVCESCNVATETLLATTRDSQGTVNGREAPRVIASLSATGSIQEGNEILARASWNNLISEGVQGFLGLSDDRSFQSGVVNIQLASNDGTARDGVEQIRGFSNSRDSFPEGADNIRRVNPNGTNRANILEVTAFADPDQNGIRRFSGGALNLRELNADAPLEENIREVILTSDHDINLGQTFAGGRRNIERVNPRQTISQNIQEVVQTDDPNEEGKRDYAGGRRNLESINPRQSIGQNIDEIIAFDDPNQAGERDYAGGRQNIEGVNPNRPISFNIQSVIGGSDVNAEGERTFGGGRLNLERINPAAPISANTQEVIKFDDADASGQKDFDGGIANLHSVNPARQLSANIDSVISTADGTGTRTFSGGRSNLERINPEAPISANIQEMISFDNRPLEGAVRQYDGGLTNLRTVNPSQELSENIDNVIAFGDVTISGQRMFSGGRENLERINPAFTIGQNIQSVIAFGDRDGHGTRTFVAGTENVKAIDRNAQISTNIATVIEFSDGGTSPTNGVAFERTFDGGARNIQSVNPNAQISENIRAVASMSETPDGSFRSGAKVLSTLINPYEGMSSAIRNVQDMSDTGSFTSGAANIRTVGGGSITSGIESIIKLGRAVPGENTTSESAATAAVRGFGMMLSNALMPGVATAITAGLTQAPPSAPNAASGIAAIRAAGDGSITRGLEALMELGADRTGNFSAAVTAGATATTAAGREAFDAAISNLIAMGVNSPQQIQAMAVAGSGKLADGLTRIQQYGGFEKLSNDFGGDVLTGAQHLRSTYSAISTYQSPAQLSEIAVDAISQKQKQLAQQHQAALAQQHQAAVFLQAVANAVALENTGKRESDAQTAATAVVRSASASSDQADDMQDSEPARHAAYAPPVVTVHESVAAQGAALKNAAAMLARLSDVASQFASTPGLGSQSAANGRSPAQGAAAAQEVIKPTAQISCGDAITSRAGGKADTVSGTSAATASTCDSVQTLLRQLEATSIDVRSFRLIAAGVTNHAVAAGLPGPSQAAVVHLSNDNRVVGGTLTAYQVALNMQHAAHAAARVNAQIIEAQVTRSNANAGVFDGKYIKGQEAPAGILAVSSRNNASILVAVNPAANPLQPHMQQTAEIRISRQYPVRGGIDPTGRGQQLVYVGALNVRHTKKLHLIGPEIALAALLISAGVARVRCAERSAAPGGQPTAAAEHLTIADETALQDCNCDAQSQIRRYEPRIRPTWLVRQNEDLCKLAEHLFHDAGLGWLIADLNQTATKELFEGKKRVVELHVRQKIELPVWQDIVEFRKMRLDFAIKDLITIVTDTAIDRELMQTTLAPVIAVATGPISVGAIAAPIRTAIAPAASPAPAARRAESISTATTGHAKSTTLPVLALTRIGETKQDPTAVATVTDLAQVPALNAKYA